MVKAGPTTGSYFRRGADEYAWGALRGPFAQPLARVILFIGSHQSSIETKHPCAGLGLTLNRGDGQIAGLTCSSPLAHRNTATRRFIVALGRRVAVFRCTPSPLQRQKALAQTYEWYYDRCMLALTDERPLPMEGFATTQWTLVFQAADAASPQAAAALGALYEAYFYPLYAFVRRKGHSEHDAQDFLHDFFQTLIERNYLSSVARDRGRFRAFLLASLTHFLSNQRRRARTQKRGGRSIFVSLDQMSEEAELRFQAASGDRFQTAESGFDLEWARTVLERVMLSLRREHARHERGVGQFEQLKVYLSREGDSEAYAMLAGQMGMKEGAVKVAVHRLRRRFQELLRREIAKTVSAMQEVEDELRHMVKVMRQQS
jgi:DNA-directed RNA polymerase specialized sigma24 family protein